VASPAKSGLLSAQEAGGSGSRCLRRRCGLPRPNREGKKEDREVEDGAEHASLRWSYELTQFGRKFYLLLALPERKWLSEETKLAHIRSEVS